MKRKRLITLLEERKRRGIILNCLEISSIAKHPNKIEICPLISETTKIQKKKGKSLWKIALQKNTSPLLPSKISRIHLWKGGYPNFTNKRRAIKQEFPSKKETKTIIIMVSSKTNKVNISPLLWSFERKNINLALAKRRSPKKYKKLEKNRSKVKKKKIHPTMLMPKVVQNILSWLKKN